MYFCIVKPLRKFNKKLIKFNQKIKKMKKILLTLALAAFAMTANAQWVLGGNIGIDHNNNHTNDYVTGTTTTNINILPKIGYWLNDNMQIGAQLGWGYTYTRNYAGANDTYTSHPQSNIQINPYFRYNVTSWKNFTVFCEAQLNIAFGLESKIHSFVNGSETTGFPADQGDAYKALTLRVVPGMNYSFNDKFSMDLYINLASLYCGFFSNDGIGAHTWGVGCDFTAQDLNAHLANFSIGFNYAF